MRATPEGEEKMLNFKRLNVLQKVRESNDNYQLHNLIRQTTLKDLIEDEVLKDLPKERVIIFLLHFIKEDLEKMIIERGGK